MSANRLFVKTVSPDYTPDDDDTLMLRRPRNNFPTRDLEAYMRMRRKYRYVSSSGRRPVPEQRENYRR
jgi:hypothetical protein